MSNIQALLLGLIQGLTEFLPVSSSGHLTIGQTLLQLNTSSADNLLFDVVVHAATVCSTILVFRKEIVELCSGIFLTTKWNKDKEYATKILISIIPILIIGLLFKDKVEAVFDAGLFIVGCCLIITALLLTFAFYAKSRNKDISYLNSFLIGIGQVLAVFPGISRSGATIATGLLLGDKREEVAKFSFLMVLIPILGESIRSLHHIINEPQVIKNLGVMPLIVGFIAAFISGLLACAWMIKIVKRGKLIYFAIYCAIVGLIVIFAA